MGEARRSPGGVPAARRRYGLALSAVLAAGLVIRLAVVATTAGSLWDLGSFHIVLDALRRDVLQAYTLANTPELRYPYPPGYFPFILGAGLVEQLSGLSFNRAIRLPPVLADLALAWLVQHYLGRRGLPDSSRLFAAALIALGPTFIAVSAFNGQIDSLTVLFPALALVVWELGDPRRRAWIAGAIIGAGATIKTVPCLMVLALAPSARTRREMLTLAGAAAAVGLAVVAPWLILDGPGKWGMFRYSGVPGLGSLTLLLDPDAAPAGFGDTRRTLSFFSGSLYLYWRFITGGALLLAAAFLLRYRPSAPTAALLVWFTLATFAITFTPAYYIWVLPFLLLAERLRLAFAMWVLLVPATLVEFWARVPDAERKPTPWIVDAFYSAPMLALWAGGLILLGWLARDIVRERRASARSPATPA